MNQQIREQLIGYVLGALDEGEQRLVEQQLEHDPTWREELESVQKCLEPLADAYESYDPPPDLAHKTSVFVTEESQRLQVVRPCRPEKILEGGFDTRSRWRPADWVVVGGICLAAATLFFPAVLNSRFSARIATCQYNFRDLGLALTQFSEATHERFFPAIPTEGNRAFAGVYAPLLQEAGLLSDSRLVICPESSLANDAKHFRIPTIVEIDSASGNQILLLQYTAGGTYAYNLGFIWNGQHMPARNFGRAHYVIMADAPSHDWSRGAIHGKGLNVLYEDGHVQYFGNRKELLLADDPFCNRYGRCEAGVDIEDAVVAPSYFPPVLTNISLVKHK